MSAGNEGVPAPSNLRPAESLELDDLHGQLQCPTGNDIMIMSDSFQRTAGHNLNHSNIK
jgi:hypothetical protein